MEPATLVAWATATISLLIGLPALLERSVKRLGALRPRLPSARAGGIVVLVASLAGLGRTAPIRAALPPPLARDLQPTPSSPVEATDRAPAAGYTVAPGDSLWAIASRFLSAQGGEPTDAEVDRMWRSIYETNHRVIGDDPDLIFPGTILIIPEERA